MTRPDCPARVETAFAPARPSRRTQQLQLLVHRYVALLAGMYHTSAC